MSDAPHPPGAGSGSGADPSMEDILASIRRILDEDEAAPASPAAGHALPVPVAVEAAPTAGGSGGSDDDDGVLVLDEGMLVSEPLPAFAVQEASVLAAPVIIPPVVGPPSETVSAPPVSAGLIAPETAAAAALSVGALMRTLSTERSAQVYRGGPTIEDLVREELRPLLKTWLDQNLPPMVERLVRQEIERVTGHLAP